MLKTGDRVKINDKGRQEYNSCSADGYNPLNFSGIIESSGVHRVNVLWDNGLKNNYAHDELTVIENPTRI